MISALLLAAGESRRMGDFKQLLRLGDKSFVEHCVDNLLASRVGEVVVVTGHRESEVRRAIGGRRVIFAYNAEYKSGMTSSIKRGMHAVSESSNACVLALVDQPRRRVHLDRRRDRSGYLPLPQRRSPGPGADPRHPHC